MTMGDLNVFFTSAEGSGEGTDNKGNRRGKGGNARPEDVVRAWRAGRNLVPLVDGGFAPLPADWMSKYGTLLGELMAAREVSDKVPVTLVPELDKLCEVHKVEPPSSWDGMRKLLASEMEVGEAVLPEDLTASLRDYQKEGVAWLSRLREAEMGALLADDMGLGAFRPFVWSRPTPWLCVQGVFSRVGITRQVNSDLAST